MKYAEVLLAIARPREGYTEDRIRSMLDTSEIEVRLPFFIPVHVTYQTAFVDKDGKLQFRDDIYGRDKALLAILKSDDRKVADIAIERKDNGVRREALAVPDQILGMGRRAEYFLPAFRIYYGTAGHSAQVRGGTRSVSWQIAAKPHAQRIICDFYRIAAPVRLQQQEL